MARNSWNFSHVVSARSESFGSVDSATTGRGMTEAERSARMEQFKRAWIARNATLRCGTTGRAIGIGGALAMWEQQFGK